MNVLNLLQSWFEATAYYISIDVDTGVKATKFRGHNAGRLCPS